MDNFKIDFDGRKLLASRGQTIADVILNNNIFSCRKTRFNQPRGVFCGMGVCFECRAIVDGRPNTRLCMTPATPGCMVSTQDDAFDGELE